MLQAAGTKPLREYINMRQVLVAEWVALQPILEVCAKDTGYDVGGGCASGGGVRRLRSGS